ncbi:hypothetical protein ACFLY7_01640 [Patescibacteria group bacterium]
MNETRFYLKIGLIILAIVLVVGYSYYQMRNLLNGPVLIVTSPQNGETFSESLIEITGETKNISEISLNDRPIFIDENGNFKEKMLLSYGYNVIKIEAGDRFDRKIKKILEVIYIK